MTTDLLTQVEAAERDLETERLRLAARREALEEAARVCEDGRDFVTDADGNNVEQAERQPRHDLAGAIRSLKDKP